MRHILKTSFALLAALVLLFALLPGAALADTPSPDPDKQVHIVNRSDQKNTKYYAVGSGVAGGSTEFYVPVQCHPKKGDAVTNVSCTYLVPQDAGENTGLFTVDSQVSEIGANGAFICHDTSNPNEVTAWDAQTLTAAEHGYFRFRLQLQPNAAAGQKWLQFRVYYTTEDGAFYNDVDIWFTVSEGATPTEAPISGGGTSFKGKPRILIDSYAFDTDRVYAGDTFTLGIVIRNTSQREAVNNLEILFASDTGAITPVSGGSNCIYIPTLEKNSSVRETISFQVAPDAEPKAHSLTLDMTYDGTKNKQEFSARSTITVPVLQKLRTRIEQPIIYDEALVGGSCNMCVQMFNLGKATLYNCLVTVIGEGLSLEETYYGGNLASGGTLRADLVLLPSVAGEIDANVEISYEDAYGTPYIERAPFHLSVFDDTMFMNVVTGGDVFMEFPAEPEAPGVAWYVWAGAGTAAAALITLLSVRAAKKKRRSEDF